MDETIETGEMVAIPIREFVATGEVPVDLYVRLSESKYVLIVKQESKGAAAQLQGLEARKVQHLFVRREDYDRYVGSSIKIAGIVITQKEISAAKKAEFLSRSAAAVLNEIEAFGLNPMTYEHARQTAAAITSLVEAKSDLYGLIQAIANLSDATLAHSIAASALSVMIGKTQGWTKPATFEKLALGALLHDVGIKELPEALREKPRAEMTADEVLLFETHPFRGMEILRSIPTAPDDVIAIVLEHHENSIGQGYPRKLRDLRLNPLGKVVALADAFAELTIDSGSRPRLSALDALRYVEGVMGQPFNRESFTALSVLVTKDLKSAA